MARKKQQDMAALAPVQGLWEVPAGWTWKRLGEVTQTASGGTPSRKNASFFTGSIPWVKSGELNDGIVRQCEEYITEEALKKSSAKIFKKGTLCIALYGATVGKLGILGIDAATNQAVCAIFTDIIDRSYLYYYLLFKRKTLINMAQGGAQPNISQTILAELPISYPVKTDEQQRIVARIEELFAELDKAEEALQSVSLLCGYYRQAVLRDAVSGELSKEWRKTPPPRESGEQLLQRILTERRAAWEAAEREKMAAQGKKPTNDSWKKKYKEPQPPNTAGLPELPEGWCWASFPQLGEFGRGKSKHRPRNDPKLYGGMYPFIQTGLVSSSDGVITHCTQTYNEYGLQQSKLWPAGTICITIAANIAHSAILSFPSCFPDSIVGLVVHKNISNKFIEYFIRTIRNDLEKYAPATAQKNINLEILYDVTVPIPPQQEQLYIEKLINDAFESIKDIQEKCVDSILMCKALRQSILNAAFTGKL